MDREEFPALVSHAGLVLAQLKLDAGRIESSIDRIIVFASDALKALDEKDREIGQLKMQIVELERRLAGQAAIVAVHTGWRPDPVILPDPGQE